MPDIGFHKGGINLDRLTGAVRGGKAQFLKNPLQNGIEPPRAYVFDTGIHLCRDPCQCTNAFGGEGHTDLLCRHQGRILPGQGIVRFTQDPHKIALGQRLQFYPDWKPPLQFRQEV